MSHIPPPPPDLPEVSGNKSQIKRHSSLPNYNNNNGLSPNKSSETDSSSNTSSKNATPSHPTTQTDRSVITDHSPASKPLATTAPPQQQGGADYVGGKKVWERCWSLGELKQGSNIWTLASDAGLLKYLQDFSQRVTSRTHEISIQVDGLSLESQSSCGRLENVSNKFHKLSMEQFVENRVFDEDETNQARAESNTSDPAPSEETKEESDTSGDGEVLGRANIAVKMGLDILDAAFDQVDLTMDSDSDSGGEEGSVERSTILPSELEPKDLYLLRPFPSLIGSATFYETDHLGLRLQESSGSEYGSEIFDSDGDSSGTETELKQKQRQKGGGGLAEDLGESSGDLFSEEEGAKSKSKGDTEGGDSPPLEGGGLFNTKQGKFSNLNRIKSGDEGNLFDSSSEDDNLFSEEPKKKKKEPKQPEKAETEESAQPVTATTSGTDTREQKKEKKKKKKKPFAGAVPVFGILDSDDSDEERKPGKFGESVSSSVSANSKDTLFDSDSDDGDLFSSNKPVVNVKKDNKAPKLPKQASPPVENNVENNRKDKTLFGGESLNFDDSDSDENLFENSKPENSSAVKKPPGGVKIFAGLDQDVLLKKNMNNTSAPDNKETNSPIAPIKSDVKKPSQVSKGMSLYEDSSSEDDLFSSMSQPKDTSKVNKAVANKPSAANDKEPDTNKQEQERQPSPVTSKAKLIENGLKLLSSDDDSGDDLFSKPARKEILKPVKRWDSPVLRPAVDEGGIATGDKVRGDQNNNTAPKAIVKNEDRSEGLFPQGSDSDEDLFSLVASKPIKVPQKNTTEQNSKPPGSLSTESAGLFSENDELFAVIPSIPDTTSLPPGPPPEPKATPALFSPLTEPEGDDLFDAPASLNLFAATSNAPSTAPKPKPDKAALPSLFDPIDTGTGGGSLFEQPLTIPPQQEDSLLTKSRPPNSDNHEPANLTEPIAGPKDNNEDVEQPPKPKISAGRNKDFLKELNKAMGKGIAPGDPIVKNKPVSAFEDEGELFSNFGAQKLPIGAERGASRTEGLSAPEEPAKLVGLTRTRPRGPAKRPQTRDARHRTIQAITQDLGSFFTEPTDMPNLDTFDSGSKLFNGAIEDDLFGPSASKGPSHRMKFPTDDFLTEAKSQVEPDAFFSGNPNKSKLNSDNIIEDILFPSNSHVPPVKFHSKPQPEDHMIPALPEASKKIDEDPPQPIDLPEDLFASVALPKATKSSKTGNKPKPAPAAEPKEQVQSEPVDIHFEEKPMPQEKIKRSHKVIKRTDEELFGGDDLFDAIPESKPKSKSYKPRKKKTTDSARKTKKVKELDPSTIDDIFD